MSRTNVRYVNPPALSVPTGYTYVAEVHSGRTIYSSGKVVGKNDFVAQATQVFENLKLALAAAGATFDNLVKVTTFVTDMSHLQTLRTLRAKYYGENAPASTLVQVGKLANEELMIEIEAIAVV